ncbi:hypothetical protein GCM10010466_13220 [Planomonospora alba]|uniref:Uncharacterized protein n=1 Tax=Planomonospora alba TaxID=161354 RepID=A0ABP6MRM1_9ACTN
MADLEIRAQDRETGLGEFLCDQYDGLVHWWFLTRREGLHRTSRSLSALVNAFTSVPRSETEITLGSHAGRHPARRTAVSLSGERRLVPIPANLMRGTFNLVLLR